jgi:hypothetical protein
LELGTVLFINAATINPEVSQTVSFSLFTTELDFSIALFAATKPIDQIMVYNLLVIRLPGVRKDCIARIGVADEAVQAEAAISVSAKQLHTEGGFGGMKRKSRGRLKFFEEYIQRKTILVVCGVLC